LNLELKATFYKVLSIAMQSKENTLIDETIKIDFIDVELGLGSSGVARGSGRRAWVFEEQVTKKV